MVLECRFVHRWTVRQSTRVRHGVELLPSPDCTGDHPITQNTKNELLVIAPNEQFVIFRFVHPCVRRGPHGPVGPNPGPVQKRALHPLSRLTGPSGGRAWL